MSPPASDRKQKGAKKRERGRETASRPNGRKASGARSRAAVAPAVAAARKAAAEPPAHPAVDLARQLAAIVETHSLSELVVDTPDLTLTLRRGEWGAAGGLSPMAVATPMPMALPAAAAPAAVRTEADLGAPAAAAAAGAAAAAPPAAADPAADQHVVTSPFVGTFYRSPNPDSDPYVNEGQRVEKGQILCIVEAMKLMNEIEADQAGVIAAILVQNGEAVEYGQALFRIA